MLLSHPLGQLLIIDVQERLAPAMHESENMIGRCTILLQAAARLDVPATISEQYRKGLGRTVERLDNLRGDNPVFEKMHFSCADDPALATRVGSLASAGRRQIVIAGIESHICVLQSALGFKAMGLDVAVVTDAITSREPTSVALALDRFRANKIETINTEMAVFEWLGMAGTPMFKELSALIK